MSSGSGGLCGGLAGTLAGYGTLRSGGWFDVEVPSSSPACGKPWTYTERLATATGSLVVRATGPRLCLGVETTVLRRCTVAGATGTLGRLHGAGTITLAVLSVGATETWTPRNDRVPCRRVPCNRQHLRSSGQLVAERDRLGQPASRRVLPAGYAPFA